jgi:hypothetical protein
MKGALIIGTVLAAIVFLVPLSLGTYATQLTWPIASYIVAVYALFVFFVWRNRRNRPKSN